MLANISQFESLSELLPNRLRIEAADPGRAEADLGGLEHHLGRDNAGVDRATVVTVEATLPAFFLVVANEQSQRGVEMTLRTDFQLLQGVACFDDKNPLRLIVAGRRSELSRLEDQVELFLFDRLVAEFSNGITVLGQCDEIHGSYLS